MSVVPPLAWRLLLLPGRLWCQFGLGQCFVMSWTLARLEAAAQRECGRMGQTRQPPPPAPVEIGIGHVGPLTRA